jgi:hypothetical protein
MGKFMGEEGEEPVSIGCDREGSRVEGEKRILTTLRSRRGTERSDLLNYFLACFLP